MISFGTSITTPNDPLRIVDLAYFYASLKQPKPKILEQITRLQQVHQVDPKAYSNLKKKLPYIVCAQFNPASRKRDHFVHTQYFILDLDHLSSKHQDVFSLRKRIEQDSQVHLTFMSPSQDGLKVLFKLKEKCTDSGHYTLFYKSFCSYFAKRYELNQFIDEKTCDVSRACFISYDAEAYYNPDSELVDLRSYVDLEQSAVMFDQLREYRKEVKQLKVEEKEKESTSSKTIDPDEEIMHQIKQRLNPKANARPTVTHFVPEEIHQIIPGLTQFIEDQGLLLEELISIQYGKKIRTHLGLKRAEVNVFYGKKGYSVVISPRSGTDTALNEVLALVVRNYLEMLL